ncbi:MAG: CRISPR-associated protein Cas4 [bacterium]
MNETDSISITPSQIIEFLFCPRFIYFMYVLDIPQFEEGNFKVMLGRNLHTEKLNVNKNYLRKKINAKEKYLDVYLTNKYLRGRMDEVLELNDGSLAPLDYKFAEYKEHIFKTYLTQLYCYAILIEDNFNAKVNKGFIVYTRSKNKLIEVDIPDNAKNEIINHTTEIVNIIENNIYPKVKASQQKCCGCIYRNICSK